jgi:D-alanyl-D-alanine dipeptidase
MPITFCLRRSRAWRAIGAFFVAGQVVSAAEPDLVNIRAVDPTIVIELRYAGPNNVTQRALYPPDMQPLVRPSVANRLLQAQSYLQVRGFRLKIWDAYRPKAAQDQLWQHARNADYVANPADGRALHGWGVAVDATLVREDGSPVVMPTDFDDFTPAAMLRYTGNDFTVRNNLWLLQRAMGLAGFYGMRTEWWHFIAKDWKKYGAVQDVTISSR